MTRLEVAGTVGVMAAGSVMWGLGWFAEPTTIPRWILLAFLLLPVGDVQELVSIFSERAKERMRGSGGSDSEQ